MDSTLHKVLVLPRTIVVHLLNRRAKGDLIASFIPEVFYALCISYYCVYLLINLIFLDLFTDGKS